jgi:hypothetical protein
MFYAVLNWKRIQFSESARFAWIWELSPTTIINIYWINGFYAKFKPELNLLHLLKDNFMVFGENESF